jgi:PAS domain S-box-containing protein
MPSFLNRLSTKVILTIAAFLLLLAAGTAAVVTLGFRQTERNALERSTEGLERQGGESLLYLAQREAQTTDTRLEQAAALGRIAGEYMVSMPDLGAGMPWNAARLVEGPGGQHYDPDPERRSEVWLPNHLALGPNTERALRDSAVLDGLFPAMLAGSQDVVAIYYVSPEGMGRYYPVVDLVDLLPADFRITDRPYFLPAGPDANPGRSTIWTEPYLDFLGLGPIVTASSPVYFGDEFRGVVAVDVSLSELIERLSGLAPAPGGYAFLVDAEGGLVAASPGTVTDVLGADAVQPALSAGEMLGLSLAASPRAGFLAALEAMRAGDAGLAEIDLGSQPVFLAYAPLPNTNWSLGIAAPVDEITAQSESVAAAIGQDAAGTIRLTLLLMAGFFLVALVGTLVLTRHSLTRPIRALVAGTQAVAAGEEDVQIPVLSRDELGQLATSFNRMTAQLAEAGASLWQEIEEHLAAQESLRESEERFRGAFDHAAFGMALVDTDGRFARVNQSLCHIFGYSAEELELKTFQDLTYAADMDVGMELFRALTGGERDFGWLEKRYVHRDGRVIWALLSTAAVRDRQGKTLYLVSQIQDITESKEAQAGLVEKERQYRSIFEATSDGLIIHALDGRVVEVNPAFCAMHGFSREELIGADAAAYIDPDSLGLFADYIETVRAGKAFQAQGVDLHKDGSSFHVEVHGSPFAYRGEPHVLGVVRDITERFLAREMLEERVTDRTRELTALYDVTAVASASLDLETVMGESLARVLEVMDCELGFIHLIEDEAGQLRLAASLNATPELVADITSILPGTGIAGRVVQQGAPVVVPSLRNDPHALPAAQRLSPGQAYLGAPMRAKGRVVGVLGVIGREAQQFGVEEVALLASIADQVGVAVDNARLYRQAEQLAVLQERDRLARELHDSVTQSLYSANLMVETARRSAESGQHEQLRAYLARLADVIQGSLKEMRLLVYELRPPVLVQEGLLAALQKRLDAVEGRAGVEARLLVEGAVAPAPEVEEALYRIAQEALNNALKHAGADSVTVRIEAEAGELRLAVKDDGRGFEPGDARDQGGLGLVTMRQRAERLHGTFEICSTLGQGTTVRVRLPTQPAE